MKKLLLLILSVVCILAVISCGGNTDTSMDSTNTDSSTADKGSDVTDSDTTDSDTPKAVEYKVTVRDSDGKSLGDVVVYFGEEMTFANADGVASVTLNEGTYPIKVTDLSKNEYFIGNNVAVTKDEREITVVVLKDTANIPYERIHDNGTPNDTTDDRRAYLISEDGSYYVQNQGDTTLFFLFTPTKDGIYKFYMNVNGSVGYYGAPLNAYQSPIEPYQDEDGAVTIEIKKKNLGTSESTATPYLIGIQAEDSSLEDLVFVVKRDSDPVYTPADDPYTYITNPNKLEPLFFSYKNWSVITTNIDISKENTVVYSEVDKLYHLNAEDGPIIYVRIGSASDYLPSLYEVCETSLMSSYIYDDDGNYVNKEAYNSLINQYYALSDIESGLYPLDKYIERAIKNHGNSAGWWNKKSPLYLFGESKINEDSAWLFACCTVELDKTSKGTQDSPIKVEKSLPNDIVTEKVLLEGAATLYLSYESGVEATLKLTNAEGATVIYNGTEYTAENGKITVKLNDEITEIQIVYTGDSETEISFTIS